MYNAVWLPADAGVVWNGQLCVGSIYKDGFSAIEKQIGEDVQDLFGGERVIEKVTYWGDEESQKYGEYYDDTLEWTPSDWIVVDVKFEGHPEEGYKMAYKKDFQREWKLIEGATGWG